MLVVCVHLCAHTYTHTHRGEMVSLIKRPVLTQRPTPYHDLHMRQLKGQSSYAGRQHQPACSQCWLHLQPCPWKPLASLAWL